MKVSLIIPAKGHSDRVHNKNLCKINGKSLVEIACERALACKLVTSVYLDTESDEIKLLVKQYFNRGLALIDRPKELATNAIGANEMLVYALHSIEETDLLLQSFSTTPLLKSETIDYCIDVFTKNKGDYDSFFTVLPMQEYFWNADNTPQNFDTGKLPNSQDLAPTYLETHGLYGIYTKDLIKCKRRVGNNPLMIPISKMESLDIDDNDDLEIARRLMTVGDKA